MEEDRVFLARISMIVGLIGLLTIYISSLLLHPTTVQIKDITRQRTGETVRIVGQITEVNRASDTTFFTLKDPTGSLKGVKFSESNLSKGEKVIAEGEVDIYQGELEIIVNNIKRRNA